MKPLRLIRAPLLVALCLAALCAGRPGAAEDPKATDDRKPVTDDVQDFVLLADARPVLVRLHVRVDDQPFRAAWDDFMRHLFKHLDVNGDGTLDREELERAPSAELLLARGPAGFNLPAERMAARGPFDKNKDRKVTAAELAAYYRKNGLAPLQVQVGPTPLTVPHLREQQRLSAEPRPGTAVAAATFALLDTPLTLPSPPGGGEGRVRGDGKLTREKLAAAPAALFRADRKDEEIVTAQDLAWYGALHQEAAVTEPAPVVLIDPDDPADELARRLLERYGPRADKPEDKTLTQKDIGLDNRTFALLDANKDGKLDKGELAGFARRPPDLELTVRLSAKGQPAEVELNGKKGESPLDANVKARDGGVSLDLGVVNVQVRPGPEAVRPHGLEQVHLRVVGDTMDRLDTGKKGYLDEADVRNNGFLRGAFKMIDRDGDGKVTEKELRAFYQQTGDLQARASACCVSLVFIDEGRGLFDLLDADGDGRLSVRELRQAPKLLDRLDKEGKGYVARSDVPGAWRLLVRRGAAGGIGFSGFGTFGGGGNLAVEAVPPPAKEPTAGPLWFRMMDRNGDGYVSRREFLGSDELFQKIDLDGDGLISVEEAIKADALFRKGK